jgi:hypothetical protein
VLSLQHKKALSKQLVIDLIALFTYNIKAAFACGKEVTMFTLDIQKAFDTLLKR